MTAQSYYNLLIRDIETEMVPCCQAHNIGVIPWGPLGGGFLTGKYHKGETPSPEWRLYKPRLMYALIFTERNWSMLPKFQAFVDERGHTMFELAIAWLLSKQWISTVIAGSKKLEQLKANVAAANWKLTAEEIAEVDAMK